MRRTASHENHDHRVVDNLVVASEYDLGRRRNAAMKDSPTPSPCH